MDPGRREQSLAALTAPGVGFSEDRCFDDVVDRASFLTVSWTFGFVALELAGVVKAFATPAGLRRVLDGVDLSVEPGRSSPLRAGRAPARPRS